MGKTLLAGPHLGTGAGEAQMHTASLGPCVQLPRCELRAIVDSDDHWNPTGPDEPIRHPDHPASRQSRHLFHKINSILAGTPRCWELKSIRRPNYWVKAEISALSNSFLTEHAEA